MRDMVKLIHADTFFKEKEVHQLRWAIEGCQYVESEYGLEIPNFQLIFKDIDKIFTKVVGEKVEVIEELSGKFKRPVKYIHFENFNSLDEWSFVVALQDTTFNLYHHVEDYKKDPFKVDAKSALDGYQFQYFNIFDWKPVTTIELEANQGLFFRPWLFHSLDGGLVQYYRMKKHYTTKQLEKIEKAKSANV
jgi:hypothetical protein